MNTQHNIRAAITSDAAAIKTIEVETGLFPPDDLSTNEIFAGYLEGSLENHFWIVLENESSIVGAAYFAPEPFSDCMWNLYFIGVLPGNQGAGIGAALIGHIEQTLRQKGEHVARSLIVETSSLDKFKATREFYRKQGFDEEARIREFYGRGEDKIVFWKSLE